MVNDKDCTVCKKFIKSKYKPLKAFAIISTICNIILLVAVILK